MQKNIDIPISSIEETPPTEFHHVKRQGEEVSSNAMAEYVSPPHSRNRRHEIRIFRDLHGTLAKRITDELIDLDWKPELESFNKTILESAEGVSNRYSAETVGAINDEISQVHEEAHRTQEIRMQAPSTNNNLYNLAQNVFEKSLKKLELLEDGEALGKVFKNIFALQNQHAKQLAFMEAQARAVEVSGLKVTTPEVEDALRLEILATASILSNDPNTDSKRTFLKELFNRTRGGFLKENYYDGTNLCRIIILLGNAGLIEDIENERITYEELEEQVIEKVTELLDNPGKKIHMMRDPVFMLDLDRRLMQETEKTKEMISEIESSTNRQQ